MDYPVSWPGYMGRELAALYCGMTVARFNRLVRSGVLPKAMPWGNPHVWSKEALDGHKRAKATIPPPDAEAAILRGIHAGKNEVRHRAA